MRTTLLLFLLCSGILACAPQQRQAAPWQDASVVRDCTGTYLRVSGKDYQVCNTRLLDSFADGRKVQARFSPQGTCREADGRIVCMMYHEHEGWIQVLQLR